MAWFWAVMTACGLVIVLLFVAGVADYITHRDCAAACAPASPVLRGPIGAHDCFCDDSVVRPVDRHPRDDPLPLNLSALTSSPGIPGASERDYPATYELAAHEWATAIGAWASGVTPPSTTVAAATAALEAALVNAFKLPTSSAIASAFDAALATFAATVAAGMLPLYTAAPPAAPLGIASLFTSQRATRQEGVAAVAAKLDAWMRTGLAVLVAPPKTSQPWA